MKNWQLVGGVIVAVGAVGGAWWWYRRQHAAAAAAPALAPVVDRAPIQGVLPAPQMDGARVVEARGLGDFSPSAFLGRPDVAARRAAGAQAAAGLKYAATAAAASAWRAGVSASNFASSLGDSTATSSAAKSKATQLAVAAANDSGVMAQQAESFAEAADRFTANKILGL